MEGITRTEFARRDGCSRTLVQRGVRNGWLKTFADGSVDPKQVKGPWREGNRAVVRQGETPADAAERIVIEEGRAPYSRVEAERVKENYLALLRQLEYDVKSGEVIRRADAAAEVARRYAKVKARLLPLGSEIAPRLAPKTSKLAIEVKEEIDAAVRMALEELSEPSDDDPADD